ncbi:Uncharacterized protein ImpH/VasB [hydrothermal vent metagenome]|uniref:Uncharacterized protein ImpH/VasB n=1 Tax=hydrothermal vent metagenome TaxID=652676 RepID=A0A3B0WLR6_9ZZZZ
MSESSTNNDLNNFFQLVRSIERKALFHALNSENTQSTLGGDGLPNQEALRFKVNNNLAFPGSSVESLKACLDESSSPDKRNDVIVNFMGLTGPSGTLPQHYSRLVMTRLKQRDTALSDFLDLFNHRLISLFYRSWVKYRFAIQYETYLYKQKKDPFTQVIQSLSGQHEKQINSAQLYYSGHFSRLNKSASNLESMLTDFLAIPIKVHTFIGQWIPIGKEDRATLGGANALKDNRLGYGILPGNKYWDRQSKIEIEIGPLSYLSFQELLPGGERFNEFKKLINSYVPIHLTIDLVFNIFDNVKNSCQLGKGLKLSRNTWVQGKNLNRPSGKVNLSRGV